MKLKKLRKHRKNTAWLSGIFSKNPILVMGFALPFAIMATTSLNNSIALSISMAITTIPTMIIASFIGTKLPYWIRCVVNVLIATVFMSMSRFVVTMVAPNIFDSLGIYFSIMAVNSIMIVRTEEYAIKVRPYMAALDGIINTIGFSLVICFIGTLRELVGNNTIMNIPVNFPIKLIGIFMPFSAFIIVGILMAFVKAVKRIYLWIEMKTA